MLSILLLIVILAGCVTTKIEYVEIKPEIAEEPPLREEIAGIGENVSIPVYLTGIILYYEELLSAWESWGILVYEAIDTPLPPSLEHIKQESEDE